MLYRKSFHRDRMISIEARGRFTAKVFTEIRCRLKQEIVLPQKFSQVSNVDGSERLLQRKSFFERAGIDQSKRSFKLQKVYRKLVSIEVTV